MRKYEPTIKAIRTANLLIELSDNQYFCTTPRAFEIWEKGSLPRMVKRIPTYRVFWVFEK